MSADGETLPTGWVGRGFERTVGLVLFLSIYLTIYFLPDLFMFILFGISNLLMWQRNKKRRRNPDCVMTGKPGPRRLPCQHPPPWSLGLSQFLEDACTSWVSPSPWEHSTPADRGLGTDCSLNSTVILEMWLKQQAFILLKVWEVRSHIHCLAGRGDGGRTFPSSPDGSG